ncbi:MAG: hypothetical protein IPL25_08915 [Saprospiraceae bacterium]|nr:hypothetical protein [Candidatus Vicinibacter affinis]
MARSDIHLNTLNACPKSKHILLSCVSGYPNFIPYHGSDNPLWVLFLMRTLLIRNIGFALGQVIIYGQEFRYCISFIQWV